MQPQFPPIPPSSSPSLSPSQLFICQLAQQFTQSSTPELEQKLKQSNWQDVYSVIIDSQIDYSIRVVCCSVMKWLIYHRKFVTDPMGLFGALARYYVMEEGGAEGRDGVETGKLSKGQQIVEMVLEVIPGTYMTEKQKLAQIDSLLKLLSETPPNPPRILTLIKMILQSCQIEHINNQVIAGQLLIFLQRTLKNQQNPSMKIQICQSVLKQLQHLVELVNSQDDIQANHVEEFLIGSTMARGLIEAIIVDGSDNQQILSTNNEINRLKHLALEVYSSIWVYHLEENMFKLCLNTLITKPATLIDQQADIMQRVVVMLQRSINQQQYYQYLHKNVQKVVISLLTLIAPKQSSLLLLQTDPEQFVDLMYDFCMQQQRQILQTKVGSLISALTMYIDGYMSFLGSLCIMAIKKWNNTINVIPGGKQYMDIIAMLWKVGERGEEERAAICVLVSCAISDQFQKREDLVKPFRVELNSMMPMFNLSTCKFPPYMICRFMLLYSFIAIPKCLDPFLPYKDLKPVYSAQLQCCYRVLQRYYTRYPQFKKYLDQIGPPIILSSHLTPLLQSTILTGDLNPRIQFKILEKLVNWLDEGIGAKNYAVCNKMANLVAILVQRMEVGDYGQVEEGVFGYLEHLFRIVGKPDGKECQQFVVEICVAFVKRFPSLEKSPQRLAFIIEMGFKIIQRNNGTLNSCLDLFFQLTRYLSQQPLYSLIQIYIGCLQSQQREQDQWQCYYGLENCMLRIYELGAPLPRVNLGALLAKAAGYRSGILTTKVYMFVCSVVLAGRKSLEQDYQQFLAHRALPTEIPPYQNKPLLLYLFTLVPTLEQTSQQSHSYLSLILTLLSAQKSIQKSLKAYQQQTYCNMSQTSQLAINSYGISQKLPHPLIMKNLDVYNEFRKCWNGFQNKEYLGGVMSEQEKEVIKELSTQATVNSKVRKIVKVKGMGVGDGMEEESGNK